MNLRALAAAAGANSLTSPADMKHLGADNAKGQLEQALANIVKNRRKDNFFLKVKATATAADAKAVFFNALGMNSNASSNVTFTTNAPGGHANVLKALYKEGLVVRGLTITVSDESLWDLDWYVLDGDFRNSTAEEFNSVLDSAKQQITDDPKTRIIPIDLLVDGYFGLMVEGIADTETIQIIANVVGIPTRIR